jgi:hypothetical protein
MSIGGPLPSSTKEKISNIQILFYCKIVEGVAAKQPYFSMLFFVLLVAACTTSLQSETDADAKKQPLTQKAGSCCYKLVAANNN